MSRSRRDNPRSRRDVPPRLTALAKPPLAIILGSPAEVVHLLAGLGNPPATCYQIDLYQSERLRGALTEAHLTAEVVALPDLWDLSSEFQTAIYLPARGGERELKIDMVEQAFHILRPRGTFAVWSPETPDHLFPALLKKIFRRASSDVASAVYWATRDGDRPRRRHEVTFQSRIGAGASCRFVSRPGTFSYGQFDNGSRALAEVSEIESGDRVVDLGCGIGVNGVFAWQRCGPTGHVAFVDSNVRATALAQANALANGVASFEVHASAAAEGPEHATYDVVLANPPYFADHAITRLFIHRARELLTPQGRLFLVTRQPNPVVPFLEETFGAVEAALHRGYTILVT